MKRVRLCAASDLVPGSARRFDVEGYRIAVVRVGDDFYGIGDRCTHQDVSLAEGEVDVDELEIECWKHGSRFSLITGEARSLPATKPEPVYRVGRDHTEVFVELEPATSTPSRMASTSASSLPRSLTGGLPDVGNG